MKKILNILLLEIISVFCLNGCKIQNNNLEKNNEFIIEANQDIRTFYEIRMLVFKKIRNWWNNKLLIDSNNYFYNNSQINDFYKILNLNNRYVFDDEKEINKWNFLKQLIDDFKKEINNINKEIIDIYSNFYNNQEKELPISLLDNDIEIIINKTNFNNISKLFTINNKEKNINAFEINLNINYSIKFKEFDQIFESTAFIAVTDNINILNNIQKNVELWFINFVQNLFSNNNNRIIDTSESNFNNINSNTIWQIIKKELNKRNIITNHQPYFSDFFNTLNLWSKFNKYNSILSLTNEGYQSNKLTTNNFLNFYKNINSNIIDKSNYYLKANIRYFIANNFTIENLPFNEKYDGWKMLNKPIEILVPKEKFDRQLLQFSEKVIDFWNYYKLETYNNKIIFNMNKEEFDFLSEKINLFKSDDSINIKLFLIFEIIFNFFNNKSDEEKIFKLKIFDSITEYLKNKQNPPKFKMEIINNDKEIIIKLFRNRLHDGDFPNYYINFSYNDFAYSFFINPDNNEANNINIDNYLYFQTIEFKII